MFKGETKSLDYSYSSLAFGGPGWAFEGARPCVCDQP